MKLVHLSDLHIGKRVNEFSMLEDQSYILSEIIKIVKEIKPDAVIIAGDIYDKSVPSAEAVTLFDDFLFRLSQMNLKVFIISGNHDSPERLAFGSRLMDSKGIYMSPVYDGDVKPVKLSVDGVEADIYMLPFVKPVNVRRFFEDKQIDTYSQAVNVAVNEMNVNREHINILVTHQFVTGADTCESEEISVGGTDNVDSNIFKDFDYVALGHIHGPQKISRETIRYCGTPLKYSFSEVNHKKSLTVVDINSKEDIKISTIPLKPLHDLKEIKGTYLELTARDYYSSLDTEDYYHITLTDEEDIPEAIGKLRTIYKNIMKLDYDNNRTRNSSILSYAEDVHLKSPFELFCELFEKQNGNEMSQSQQEYTQSLIEDIWEGR